MKKPTELAIDATIASIGHRLAALRISRSLTQAQLAEQAGLGLRTVQRLETGAAATNLGAFIAICRVLGILDQIEAVIPEPRLSPIAQLRRRNEWKPVMRVRERKTAHGKPWTWGDDT